MHHDPDQPDEQEPLPDMWENIAAKCEQIPPSEEPAPGWAATMADLCRDVARLLTNLSQLNPPCSLSDLHRVLAQHDKSNAQR